MKRLLVLAIALSGCAPAIDGIDSLATRAGGGVIALGSHSYYDGLAENEHNYVTRFELDRDGDVRARDYLGDQPFQLRMPKPGPTFADGSRVEMLPNVSPLQARRSDAAGNELWRVALPIVVLVDWTNDDADGAVVLTGRPDPATEDPPGGTILELAPDGRILWHTHLP
ncbi:MAG: hypothetical protein JWM53_4071 [bacterium]|nr:hypothetical protein [bacterium]